jgi:hypothetical protein
MRQVIIQLKALGEVRQIYIKLEVMMGVSWFSHVPFRLSML